MPNVYTAYVYEYYCKHKNVYFLMDFIYYVSFFFKNTFDFEHRKQI